MFPYTLNPCLFADFPRKNTIDTQLEAVAIAAPFTSKNGISSTLRKRFVRVIPTRSNDWRWEIQIVAKYL